MSYDVWLVGETCGKCGRTPRENGFPNPTYNLTPVFDLALTGEEFPDPGVSEGSVVALRAVTSRPRGLRLLSGKTAAESLPVLRVALGRHLDPQWRSRFLALEPENKWGTLGDAVEAVAELLKVAEQDDVAGFTWDIR